MLPVDSSLHKSVFELKCDVRHFFVQYISDRVKKIPSLPSSPNMCYWLQNFMWRKATWYIDESGGRSTRAPYGMKNLVRLHGRISCWKQLMFE